MSALDQNQTFAPQKIMSALPLKADICGATRDVRFGPKADITCRCAVQLSPKLSPSRRNWRIRTEIQTVRYRNGLIVSVA